MMMVVILEYIKTVRLKALLLQLVIMHQCALTADSTWW